MQFATSALTLVAAAAGLSTAAALPAPVPSIDAVGYHWHISDFGFGCSPGGCTGGGTISGGAHKGAPAFTAHCSATGYDEDYVKCKGAKNNGDHMQFWFNDDNGDENLIVHFRYTAGGKTFQATRTIPTPPFEETVNFTMKPRKK